ncbi:acetate kinase [Psychrobium sp. 1_MG-2023]|uniref:acetate kinase n=1 Tax=Psychrobium sp. 1_MG-2023 TaxID=3062624 RepID=UPI000C348632|nr:acetate kinase [Psychrobium sp. 1_MG-2023]MDP2560221.1 acetate kinase [Psychrobium sp. 1_MG-2023]PKF57130.1 acetate kinase [Alteromonadales bacterium alter-6D02]
MTDKLVFILNCGSSSLKFALIDTQTQQQILSGLADSLASDSPIITIKYQGNKHRVTLPAQAAHQQAIDTVVAFLQQHQLATHVVAVGHRVVHGGEAFTESVIITPQVLSQIEQVSQLAPLHNPANIIGIKAAQQAFNQLPQVAVFDTAFHQTIPAKAYLYPLPYSLYEEHGIRRYGFHGTSHFYVTQQASQLLGIERDQLNIISAHLGNGASVTAIKNGQSVDTSMGLTPLEGLVMGTRCGDIDPAISHFLIDQLGYQQAQVNQLLNKESGLLGLSQLSNDCRVLEEEAEQGHEGARLALDIFCYRLAKYIASYTVPLGQLDAVVFTGGIGENSDMIRENVLRQLSIFGFKVDHDKNQAARFGASGIITNNAGPQAIVIPTNEELVIAQDSIRLIQQEQ